MTIEVKSQPRARRQSSKGEATRRALMDAAFREFAAKGFLRTQIADIARAAGKSSGVVYIYFRNKDEILDAWIDECDATVPWYQADTSLLFEKARWFIFESYWTLYERYGAILDALESAALVSDHFHERRAGLQRLGHDSIARVIRHAQAEGRSVGVDPELTAMSIAALIERSAAYWFANRAALEARGIDRAAAMANLETLYLRIFDGSAASERDMITTNSRVDASAGIGSA